MIKNNKLEIGENMSIQYNPNETQPYECVGIFKNPDHLTIITHSKYKNINDTELFSYTMGMSFQIGNYNTIMSNYNSLIQIASDNLEKSIKEECRDAIPIGVFNNGNESILFCSTEEFFDKNHISHIGIDLMSPITNDYYHFNTFRQVKKNGKMVEKEIYDRLYPIIQKFTHKLYVNDII